MNSVVFVFNCYQGYDSYCGVLFTETFMWSESFSVSLIVLFPFKRSFLKSPKVFYPCKRRMLKARKVILTSKNYTELYYLKS